MTYLGSQTAIQSEFDEAVVRLNYFHQVSYLLSKSAFQSWDILRSMLEWAEK